MHIVSNVIGKFNNKTSIFETLLSGFPAGTVSGAPKIRAMEIIDELEKNKRKIICRRALAILRQIMNLILVSH